MSPSYGSMPRRESVRMSQCPHMCLPRHLLKARGLCLAAGALGLDPYSLDDKDARLIEQSATIFKGEQLREFLSAIQVSSAETALGWIEREEDRLGSRIALPNLKTVADRVRNE